MAMEKTYEVIGDKIIRIGGNDDEDLLRIQVGTVKTLNSNENAYVNLTKVDSADSIYQINFGIPRGASAETTSIQSGRTYTLPAGENARAELRYDESNAKIAYLDLYLPKGADGTNGINGTDAQATVVMPSIMTGNIQVGTSAFVQLRQVGEVYYFDMTIPRAPDGICPEIRCTASGLNSDQEPIAEATYVGTNTYNIKFGIPKGVPGDAPKMSVIATSTLAPGTNAWVSMSSFTNNENKTTFNYTFGIPRGEKGDKGDTPTSCATAGYCISAATAGVAQTLVSGYVVQSATNCTSALKATSATSTTSAATAGVAQTLVSTYVVKSASNCTNATSATSASKATSATNATSAATAGYAETCGNVGQTVIETTAFIDAKSPFGIKGGFDDPPYFLIQNTGWTLPNVNNLPVKHTVGGILFGGPGTTSIVYQNPDDFVLNPKVHSFIFGIGNYNGANNLVLGVNGYSDMTNARTQTGRGMLQLIHTNYPQSDSNCWAYFKDTSSSGTGRADIIGCDSTITPIYSRTGGPKTLGCAYNRWDVAYLKTAVNVSSDKRLKTDIDNIPDAILDAIDEIELKIFKFKASIEEKTDIENAEARFHSGILAQDAEDIFKKRNLDISKYSFFCHDVFDDKKKAGKDGKIEFKERDITTGETFTIKKYPDEYAIRYEEFLVLKCEALTRKIKKQEERISTLEERLEALEKTINTK